MALKYPSIPVPTSDPDALYNTCMALKQTVEALMGVGNPAVHSPIISVQAEPPGSPQNGDFWLAATGTNTSLNVYYAGRWYGVGTLT